MISIKLSKFRKKLITISAITSILSLSIGLYVYRKPDITIIGPIKAGDGLGRNTIDFIKILSEKYHVNCLPTYFSNKDLDSQVAKIIRSPNKRLGKVILFTKPIWTPHEHNLKTLTKISKSKNSIKIAYSMFESSLIPPEWAIQLNKYFDLVAVPDEYLVDVYKKSGVTIPIKVLPLCIDFTNLAKQELKKEKNELFTFSILSSGIYRKNILQAARSFARLFANNPDVILRINCRYGLDKSSEQLKDFIKKNNITNIRFSQVSLDNNSYLSLLKQSDCLMNVSMGEGFSIQPREAMTLGIPCIVTNNTAQKTICQTGLVASVECPIKEAAYHFFSDLPYGDYFKCEDNELAEKMWDVYSNYQQYLKEAPKMREWAMKYDLKSLKTDYEEFFNLDNLCQMLKSEK